MLKGARHAALERATILKEQLWGEEGGEDKYVACSLRQVRSGQAKFSKVSRWESSACAVDSKFTKYSQEALSLAVLSRARI
jgi:hypothetical protein